MDSYFFLFLGFHQYRKAKSAGIVIATHEILREIENEELRNLTRAFFDCAYQLRFDSNEKEANNTNLMFYARNLPDLPIDVFESINLKTLLICNKKIKQIQNDPKIAKIYSDLGIGYMYLEGVEQYFSQKWVEVAYKVSSDSYAKIYKEKRKQLNSKIFRQLKFLAFYPIGIALAVIVYIWIKWIVSAFKNKV